MVLGTKWRPEWKRRYKKSVLRSGNVCKTGGGERVVSNLRFHSV